MRNQIRCSDVKLLRTITDSKNPIIILWTGLCFTLAILTLSHQATSSSCTWYWWILPVI